MKEYFIVFEFNKEVRILSFDSEDKRDKFIRMMKLKHNNLKYFTFEEIEVLDARDLRLKEESSKEEDIFEKLRELIEEHKKEVKERRKKGGKRLVNEKTLFGVDIRTSDEFIEDLCDRLNRVYNTAMGEPNKEMQLAYLIGGITGLTTRLNRVCERK